MSTHDAGTSLDQLYRRFTAPLARRLAGWPGVTANRVSTAAFVTGGVAAPALIAAGRLRAAGLAFVLSDVLDYVDGDVARAQGKASPQGDVLDGILDRYTDIACLAAMTASAAGAFGPARPAAFVGRPAPTLAWALGVAATAGSVLPSYLKALAVANGRGSTQSVAGRGTRNRIVWAGLLAEQPFWTVTVLGALSHVAAVHRAAHTVSRRGELP